MTSNLKEEVFKAGVGDNEDLKPFEDYRRITSKDFTASTYLTGSEEQVRTIFPKLTAVYELKAVGSNNVKYADPVNYDINLSAIPNLELDYHIEAVDPNTGDVDYRYPDSGSLTDAISVKDGNKFLLDLTNTDIPNDSIVFDYTPSLLVGDSGTVSMSEMYTNWVQFDRTTYKDDTYDGPYADWNYDSGTDRIYNTNNQGGISGFYNEDDLTAQDYKIETEMYTDSNDDDFMGLCFRYQDDKNFYYFFMNRGDNDYGSGPDSSLIDSGDGAGLYKIEDGNITELDFNSGEIWQREVYEPVSVEVYGSQITVYHDRELILSAKDDTFSEGAFGPISRSQPDTYFRSFQYEDLIRLTADDYPQEGYVEKGNSPKQLTTKTYSELLDSKYDDYVSSHDGTFYKKKYYTDSVNDDIRFNAKNFKDDIGVRFTGSNSGVEIPNADFINEKEWHEENTIEVDFKTEDDITSTQEIWDEGGSIRGLHIYIEDGDIYIGGVNDNDDDSTTPWGPKYMTTPASTDTRYRVGLIFDYPNDRLIGVVNGTQVGEINNIGRMYKHAGGVGIAMANHDTYHHDGPYNVDTAFYFKGTVYEARYWTKALDPNNLFQDVLGNEDGLAASWVFEEGEGDVVNDLINNLDGTILNGTWVNDSSDGEFNEPVEVTIINEDAYIDYDIEAIDDSPSNEIDLFWDSTNSSTTSNDEDVLYAATDYQLDYSYTGEVVKPKQEYLELPDVNDLPSDIGTITSDSDGYKVLFEFTNNNQTNTVAEFRVTDDQTTTHHEVNGIDTSTEQNDQIIVTSTADWKYKEEVWESNPRFIECSLNGSGPMLSQKDYLGDLTINNFVEHTDEDSQYYGYKTQDFKIKNTKQEDFEDKFIYPSSIIEDTVEYQLAVNDLYYKVDDGSVTEVNTYSINFEDTGLKTTSNQNTTVRLSSDYSQSETYIVDWSSNEKELNGIAKIDENWIKYCYVNQDGTIDLSGLPSEVDKDEVIIFDANYDNLLEPINLISKTSNEVVDVEIDQIDGNSDLYKLTGRLKPNLIWNPFVHNGYFYISSNPDTVDNSLIDEFYFYCKPKEITLNNINAYQWYYLDGIPKQFSPVIVQDSSLNKLNRASFSDLDNNLTFKNKETLNIKEETEKKDFEAYDQDGNKLSLEAVETNTLKFNPDEVEVGQIVDIYYCYDRSSQKSISASIRSDYTVLVSGYINSIYVTYSNIDLASLEVKQVSDNTVLDVAEINKNFVELDTGSNLAGAEVEVEYELQDSYIIEYNTDQNNQSRIKFNNDYGQVNIAFESAVDTPYRRIESLNYNPYANDISEGFLFITNRSTEITDLKLYAYPDKLNIDRNKETNLKIVLVDEYRNPVPYFDVQDNLSISSNYGSIKFAQKMDNGDLKIVDSIPETDINGSVYAIYTFTGSESITSDTVTVDYNGIIKEVDLELYKPELQKHTIKTDSFDDTVLEDSMTKISAAVHDQYYYPVEGVEVNFTSSWTNLETAVTDEDGKAYIDFDDTSNLTSRQKITITAEASLDDQIIQDSINIELVPKEEL